MAEFTTKPALIIVACLSFLLVQSVSAQEHVVSSHDLHDAIVEAHNHRQSNLKKVQDFLTSEQAAPVIEKAGVLHQVQEAIPALSDQELDRLAQQVEKIEQGIVAGALSNQELTYIVVALVTAVIILVIVAA